MSVVREFMTTNAQCVKEDQTLQEAAVMMRDLDCGSLPICGSEGKLKGFITDRDIVLKCVAEARDPWDFRAIDMAHGSPHWIDADAQDDVALAMIEK
jgi:CBS domain-containing protein